MDIHSKIKLARLMSGYRQVDLADMLDIKQSVVARYEAEGGRVPRAEAVEKIAKGTGWPVDWFESDRLEGLIVSSPTLPHITYSETALATIERGLSSLLPELFSLPVFKDATAKRLDQHAVKNRTAAQEIEQIYLIYNDRICLVLFVANKVNSIVRKLLNTHFDIQSKQEPESNFIFDSLWKRPYGNTFRRMLMFSEVPEKYMSIAKKERDLPISTTLKFILEITPLAGLHQNVITEIETALMRSGFKVHSVEQSPIDKVTIL